MRHSLAVGTLVAALVGVANSALAGSLKDEPTAAPTPIHYFRIDAGMTWSDTDQGTWVSPSNEGGARGNWRLEDDEAFIAGIAVGRTLMPGLRGDISGMFIGGQRYDGCRIPGGQGNVPACGQASVESSVDTAAIMANIFVEPLTLLGHGGRIRPFLTAGIGVAFNDMNGWTRINPTNQQHPIRNFSGDTETSFAWTIGGGASIDIGSLFGGYPVALDVTYRYIDAGHAEGGLVPDVGNGIPNEALNYDVTFHAVTAGLRVPF
ncbi:MAG: porin family protein [Hyphomicrobiaceae bacterium]|nr:porin family protein [Hyphomicrobiaceae bacterium]